MSAFVRGELAARLAIENFRAENYLKGETLVYLLSLARAENQFRIADSITGKLARVGEKIIRDFLRNKNFSEIFIEETVGETIGKMFVQILGRAEISYDFWEKNFYVSLQRLVTNHLRKHGAEARLTGNFSDKSDAENEGEFDFESSLPKPESLMIEEKFDLKEIVGKMSEENRQIFILHRVEGWTQEQIAVAFGITARTVRNRLKQIDEFLEDFRSRGEE